MKKIALATECIFFFILPIVACILYLFLVEVDKNDIARVVYQVPFICLIAILGLFTSWSIDDNFYIKIKFAWGLAGILPILGGLALILYDLTKTYGFPENTFLIILMSSSFFVHILYKLEALKDKIKTVN